MEKEYKRQDRSVNSATRAKISNSLHNYNAAYPRGKAAEGSQWSQRISDGLRQYWGKIPKHKSEGEMIANGDVV